MTALVVLLTEEGFFRGWLWGSLERRDLGLGRVLAVSSIGFALWHWSWVTLDPDSRLPPLQIPVFLANAALLGAIWGLLRWRSGSILVASVSHGLWNGLDYVLFGAGPKVGALGIVDTAVYGPEVGLLGLVANLAFAALLWRRSIGDGLAPNARAPVARAAP
jgi:membrane protease YdiL (CAAX protease family)